MQKIIKKDHIMVLREIKRLSKSQREFKKLPKKEGEEERDVPKEAHEVTALIIDMLCSVLLGQLTETEFLELLSEKEMFESVLKFYTIFFTATKVLENEQVS